jgi:hypothetical protein
MPSYDRRKKNAIMRVNYTDIVFPTVPSSIISVSEYGSMKRWTMDGVSMAINSECKILLRSILYYSNMYASFCSAVGITFKAITS